MSFDSLIFPAIFLVVGAGMAVNWIASKQEQSRAAAEQAEKDAEREAKALRKTKGQKREEEEDDEEREERFARARATVADTPALEESSFTPAPATISGSLVDTCLQE